MWEKRACDTKCTQVKKHDHRAICTNQFLHKIGRFDSPNCSFYKKFPETLLHLFCQCEKVSPLWDDFCFLINSISEESFNFSVFEKMFGVTDTSEHDNCISYLFLYLKYYIHRCKFQESDLFCCPRLFETIIY